MLALKAQRVLKMLFPEEAFCIDQGADQALTEVSIKIIRWRFDCGG